MIHGLDNLAPPMLRGSYAGGSLAVTARCPVRRSGPSAILHARVQAPGARLLGVRVRTVPAELRPRHSRLCYSSAHQCYSLPSHSETEQGLRISSRLLASPSPCAALGCFAFPSRTPLCSASPLRCRAGLRRRVILHFKAVARQISEELCLRLATLRFAFASPRTSKPSLRCPYRSIAVACRGFASPSPRGALLCVTVAVRCRSWPSYPMPLRIGSLPVLRGAVRFLAAPLPIASQRCSSFADLGSAVHFHRRAGQSKSLPSQLSA